MLPDKHVEVEVGNPNVELPVFLMLRERWAKRILKAIDSDSATGPDLLPGRILRECASALAKPVAKLAQRLLRDGAWPQI